MRGPAEKQLRYHGGVAVFRPDKKGLRFEAELQAHPLYIAQREPIRAWLRGFRAASSPGDYYRLHRELFNWFYACQGFEEESRGREKEIAVAIKAAKACGAERHQLRPLSEQLASARLNRKVAGCVLAVFRDLADALAWKLFRYQRPVLTALGQGSVVGRLSKDGLETELDEIQWLWEERGVFALHADITTCIRHGDVWAFESLDPLEVYVTESKKSGKFNPNSPQGKRLQRLQELLHHGAHPEGARGKPLKFDRPGIRYSTYHHSLRELLAEARQTTYVGREIDAGLAIEVWDETNPASTSREDNQDRQAKMRESLGWTEDSDTIAVSAALRRVRSRQLDHNFPSLAPLALTPLAVDDTADLILGGIDFITTLHLPTLEDRLAEKDIEAWVARGPDVASSFLQAGRGAARLTVPATVREQVQIELMELDTLTDTIDWFLADIQQRRTGRPHVELFYEEEERVWEDFPD